MTHVDGRVDTVVVGGGVAGLTAAAILARTGRAVSVFERASEIGGRAATRVERGFHLNLGPHAWYLGGPGTHILETLGVSLPGRPPRVNGAFGLYKGNVHTLPVGLISLLTTDVFGLRSKLEAARVMGMLRTLDTSRYDDVPLAAWLKSEIADDGVRDVVEMLLRVASYTNAPTISSAGAALASMQLVMRHNVRYIDGGWGSIVDSLLHTARAAGARVHVSSPVSDVLIGNGVEGVRLHDGRVVRASNVIVAGTPAMVRELLPGVDAVQQSVDALIPAKAACLDVAMERLPRPNTLVAFGIDEPLYYSVHSAAAALASNGGAVVHVAKYLDPTRAHDAGRDELELEAFMDRLQPEWRSHMVTYRHLPSMTVTHGIPTAAGSGLRGRPSVRVDGVSGLYLAGDWVGSEGTLANAAVASAAHATAAILSAGEAVVAA